MHGRGLYLLAGLDFEGRRRRRHLRLLREAAAATAVSRGAAAGEGEGEERRSGGMSFGDWATEERATRCIDLVCFLYAGLMGLIWAEHSFCGLLFYLGSLGLVRNRLTSTSLVACLGLFFVSQGKQNFFR
jgi:hypothetical protein